MQRRAIITLILVLLSQLVLAQAKTDSIEIRRHWYGIRLVHDGKKVRSMRQLSNIIRPDPAAYQVLKKAKHTYAVALSLAFTSLAVLTADDVYVFNKGAKYATANTLFEVGVGVLVVSYPFALSSSIKEMRAVRKYNGDLRKTGYNEIKPELYFSFTGATLGLGIKF